MTESHSSRRMLRRDIPRLLISAALTFAALFSSLPAVADDDLPGRVGRMADVGGDVFLAPQDAPDQWNVVGLNYPVAAGDNLWVGKDGRAEIDLGAGQFRLSGETSLHVSRLDDRNVALFIAQGIVILRVRVLEPGDTAHIDTPNVQVVLSRPGLYRIEVAADGQHSVVAVREGEATVDTGALVQQVLPGQSAMLDGVGAVYAQVRNGVTNDGFDDWSAARDRYYERTRANAPVSRQMVGSADLDDYGTWESEPDYGGAVWYPANVAADWAPYRVGYWTEVGDWGPTWVDAAPWGYAPFHYGRWAHIHGRWGWCPGAYVARPAWAPALVGWVGGPGWRIGLAGSAPVYGWVPLGWGESYQPHWRRCTDGCWARYNKPYAVNVNVRIHQPPARYTNSSAPGAVTAVSAPVFSGRRPVQANLIAVNTTALATAPVLATPPVRSHERAAPGARSPNGMPQPASAVYAATPRPPRTAMPATTVAPPSFAVAPPAAARTGNAVVPSASPTQVAKPQPAFGPSEVGTNTGAARHPAPVSVSPPTSRGQFGVNSNETGPRTTPGQSRAATPGPVPPSGYVPQGTVPPPRPVARTERIPVPAAVAPATPLPTPTQLAPPALHTPGIAPAPRVAPAAPHAVAPAGPSPEAPKVEKPFAPKAPAPGEAPAK